jgi:uncharacterized protein YnzC (UPF0291/DUF896 family)
MTWLVSRKSAFKTDLRLFYMEVDIMAGSFRIEGYLPFYNNSMTRTGSNGGRSVSSYASGLFASSNAKSLGDDSFNKVADGINDDAKKRKQDQLKQIRDSLRQMQKEQRQKEYMDQMKQMQREQFQKTGILDPKPSNYVDDFLKMSGAPDEEEEEEELVIKKYNYKDVANKILRAKNSQSAGQAVLSAKRKVLEVKRMIGRGEGDPEELQLALTHAKRMEMAARKKKHHLELEEFVEHSQKRKENMDKEEDQTQDLKSMMTEAAELEVEKQEDAIFEARQDMIAEVVDSVRESGMEASDEAFASINEMISEFGEEELEMLEETMAMLEEMEIANPNMSEEDLEELKKKHRASENKAIAKANMDYLKGMFKHMEDKKAAGITHSMGSGTGFKMPMTMGGAGISAIEGTGPDPGGAPAVAAVFVDSGGSSGSVDVSI